VAAEPDITAKPVMVDSSKWTVLEKGLQNLQGKGVVNSISLKEGEEAFKERARRIRRYGAAAVVMAFDEKGQADSLQRRIEICKKSYDILVDEVGFPPEDIISIPTCSPWPRPGGAQQLRRGLHRGHARIKKTCRMPR